MYRSRLQKYSETNLFAVSATLAATESPMTESPHILIIEDDREIGSLVTRYLRANECRVTALADGRGVERILDGHRVDLIVPDLMLPGEDGLSICKKLRTNSARIRAVLRRSALVALNPISQGARARIVDFRARPSASYA